jgi:hypothetical protein
VSHKLYKLCYVSAFRVILLNLLSVFSTCVSLCHYLWNAVDHDSWVDCASLYQAWDVQETLCLSPRAICEKETALSAVAWQVG